MISSGDQQAFTRIYEHYNVKIYSVAVHILKSSDIAEEVVQEVFLKVWKKRAKLTGIVDFENYLFIMARNTIFDILKKTAREITLKEAIKNKDYVAGKADLGIIEEQYTELLQKAVNLLPPQQKKVFTLAREEGLTHKVIAKKLNLSPLTVKKHMAQALKFIRLHLQDHLEISVWLALCFCNYYR